MNEESITWGTQEFIHQSNDEEQLSSPHGEVEAKPTESREAPADLYTINRLFNSATSEAARSLRERWKQEYTTPFRSYMCNFSIPISDSYQEVEREPENVIVNSTEILSLDTNANIIPKSKERKKSTYKSKKYQDAIFSEFETAYGIELTYICSHALYLGWRATSGNEEIITYLKEEADKHSLPYNDIDDDSGLLSCIGIEISTPPFRSFKEMEKWYSIWESIINTTPFKANYSSFWKGGDDTWYGTGGGHIHTGIPISKYKGAYKQALYCLNLATLITERPWLNWLFNEPIDIANANSFLVQSPIRSWRTIEHIYQRKEYASPRVLVSSYINMGRNLKKEDAKFFLNTCDTRKDYAFRITENTVELRFFDAPIDFNQLSEHIAISNWLVKEAKRYTDKDFEYKIDSSNLLDELRNSSKEDLREYSLHNLRTLCKDANLDYNRYEKYIENFDERILYDEPLI